MTRMIRRHTLLARVAPLLALLGACTDGTEPRRAAALAVVTEPQASAQAGLALATAPVVELRDQHGAAFPRAGVAITAAVTGGGTLAGPATQTTDAQGRATFPDLVISGTVGARALEFSAPGLTKATSASITLAPGLPASMEASTPASFTAVVGTDVAAPPAVLLKDASGNVVPGIPVTFTAPVGATTAVTQANGVAAMASLRMPTAAGQYTVTAASVGVGSVAFTGTATPDVPAAMQPTGGGGQVSLYGALLDTPLQAKVVDQYGNPTPNVVVTWGSATGAGTVLPINTATDASGIVRSNYRLGTTPGANLVRASIASRSLSADFAATALGFTDHMDVSAFHTCAIDDVGILWCWGKNEFGELGDRTTVHRASPVRVFGDLRWKRVTTGLGVTCGLTTGGAAYCWGYGMRGTLGNGSPAHRAEPTPVAGGHTFTEIATMGYAACGLTAVGTAYCWGSNEANGLGVGDGTSLDTCTDPLNAGRTFPCALTPRLVAGGHAFSAISVGVFAGCGLTATSELWCWGLWFTNQNGSLADPGPVRTALGYPFAKVVTAGSLTCGIVAPSLPFCWGSGQDGSLGNGTTNAWQGTPGPVWNLAATQIATDGRVSCAVATDGRPMCWGDNAYGAVGDGTTADRTMPAGVATSLSVTSIAATLYHACARAANGQIHCWGYNEHGALGTGDTGSRTTPALVRP